MYYAVTLTLFLMQNYIFIHTTPMIQGIVQKVILYWINKSL